MIVEQVAKGATSVEERLKDILKHLESELYYVGNYMYIVYMYLVYVVQWLI